MNWKGSKESASVIVQVVDKTDEEFLFLDLSKGQLQEQDILIIPFDVTDLSVHNSVFDQALKHFGTVDILVNNAGRSQRALFENIEMKVDKQMFDLNVFAVVNLSRLAVNYFNEKGSGHVAVVSSLAGVFGVPYSATYTASKHAIHVIYEKFFNDFKLFFFFKTFILLGIL